MMNTTVIVVSTRFIELAPACYFLNSCLGKFLPGNQPEESNRRKRVLLRENLEYKLSHHAIRVSENGSEERKHRRKYCNECNDAMHGKKDSIIR